MTLKVVVEGDTDIPFVRKLSESAGLEIARELDMGGKSQLDEQFPAFNSAARGSPWFVLRDLDTDAPCAGELIRLAGIVPSRWMVYRIAVREIEAWALADRVEFARFFGVRIGQVPLLPDELADPTRTIVDLCQQSTKRRIREDMVPRRRGGAQVGPLYEATIIEYGRDCWSIDRAAANSPSLARALTRLRELADRWSVYVGAV